MLDGASPQLGAQYGYTPMSPDQLTASWFGEIFNADVQAVSCKPIGDGLVGMNLRVALEVAPRDSEQVPAALVVKLPSEDPTSRATAIALHNYVREVRFYTELAETVDIRCPQCHHAEWHEETGDFVLVLEDMAPAIQGDQLAGCAPETAARIVTELGKLHGPRWGDSSLADLEWIGRPSSTDDEQLRGMWELLAPGFLATYDRHLEPTQRALLDAFAPHLPDWLAARTGPRTVTHGDFRLDNLLLGDGTTDGGPLVTAVDWQTPAEGIGVGDLSYFIGAGLLPADRRAAEHDLLEVYAKELAAYGVQIDRSTLAADYARMSFGGVVMAVLASQIVGSSERSEAMFSVMATRHLQQALDLDALDLISG